MKLQQNRRSLSKFTLYLFKAWSLQITSILFFHIPGHIDEPACIITHCVKCMHCVYALGQERWEVYNFCLQLSASEFGLYFECFLGTTVG